MTDPRAERIGQIQEEIADLKAVLKDLETERASLLAELMSEGITDLGGGLMAIRQERFATDVALARKLIPTIYDALIEKMKATYVPEPTKTDLEGAISHLPKDQRDAILQAIRLGEPTVTYSVRRK